MAKAPANIKSLARAHTATAIRTLAGIMNEKTAPHASRVAAAVALLDRGWGKPDQFVEIDATAARRVVSGEPMNDDEWEREYGSGSAATH